MGQRGRPRLPAAVKLARGTWRRDRDADPTQLPQFQQIDASEPPADLQDAGQKRWQELAPQLAAAGLLTQADLPALLLLCRCADEIANCDKHIREQGEYLPGRNGALGPHPAMLQRSRWIDTQHKLLIQFGLTPCARSSVTIAAPRATIQPRKRG